MISRNEIPAFKEFLIKSGAALVPETSEWELCRFRTDNGVSIIYTNKSGRLTFTNEAQQAYEKFRVRHSWRSVSRKRKSLEGRKRRLAERDGARCFICDFEPEAVTDLTVEHLLNFAHGGSDNDSNLCLACTDCNGKMGNLPIVQKILLREQIRIEKGIQAHA